MRRQVEDSGAGRSWMWGASGDLTPRDAANYSRFGAWCLGWAASFAVATLALDSGRLPPGALAWVVAVVPTLVGAGAVWSYVRFVRGADELLQRIHLEALAWGFGVGALFMMGYRLLERAGAPDLDINDPLLVMGLTWVAVLLRSARRYGG
jgi:hypothetical protein